MWERRWIHKKLTISLGNRYLQASVPTVKKRTAFLPNFEREYTYRWQRRLQDRSIWRWRHRSETFSSYHSCASTAGFSSLKLNHIWIETIAVTSHYIEQNANSIKMLTWLNSCSSCSGSTVKGKRFQKAALEYLIALLSYPYFRCSNLSFIHDSMWLYFKRKPH